MTTLPERVRIIEVGPRDGLQNEPLPIPTERKVEFIRRLADAGLRQIEVTAFVHPHAVPQLVDAEELVHRLPRPYGVEFSALVPNHRGLERALESGLRRIAVFTAASETFTKKNINMTIRQSLEVFGSVVSAARAAGATARGYVSTAFVCPYEGEVDEERVRGVVERLLAMGVDEVAVSDTIGAAVPTDVIRVVEHLLRTVPGERLALHFHDTRGTALANVYAGLQLGIGTYDSSAGGLGGCPFAPGAAGNLATEDLVYMLNGMGIKTGVDVRKVVEAARIIGDTLGRPLGSRQSTCVGRT
ncbi:MAG: hydroxymethylglutaryl-CoA lyase [Planctomycetes bacterium]|nr:hydroxymethylglutaryl-CoA lyase [Planctomycetota bacterium]